MSAVADGCGAAESVRFWEDFRQKQGNRMQLSLGASMRSATPASNNATLVQDDQPEKKRDRNEIKREQSGAIVKPCANPR